MAKIADFFISGVWKNGENVITHVLLHDLNSDSTFNKGEKTTVAKTANFINAGKRVKTIFWDYPGWEIGADVKVFEYEHLRTDRNKTAKDNLDNSILMNGLINF